LSRPKRWRPCNESKGGCWRTAAPSKAERRGEAKAKRICSEDVRRMAGGLPIANGERCMKCDTCGARTGCFVSTGHDDLAEKIANCESNHLEKCCKASYGGWRAMVRPQSYCIRWRPTVVGFGLFTLHRPLVSRRPFFVLALDSMTRNISASSAASEGFSNLVRAGARPKAGTRVPSFEKINP